MKIGLIISHLACGGAERVICLMANYWADRNHEVFLITLSRTGKAAFPISPRVDWRSAQDNLIRLPAFLWPLGKMAAFRSNLKAWQPDVIISFCDETNILTLLGCFGLGIPVIVSERNHPGHRRLPWHYAQARRLLYPRARAVIVQTRDILQWFEKKGLGENSVIIPNPLPERDDRIGRGKPVKLEEDAIVTVGSLTRQKGHDRLLNIVQEVIKRRPEWNLYIVGEGPERPKLEKEIHKRGLSSRVVLLGHQRDPGAILRQAKIFVFTSYYEGFPNALVEAMAAGLPVISFDCPSGPGDLIESGKNGILVPDGELNAFCEELVALIDDPERRALLGREAETIRASLGIEKIMRQWDDLVKGVLS